MADDFRTIRMPEGMLRIDSEEPIVIDPPTCRPENYGAGKARWGLSPETVGMLERVCRARFHVLKLIPDMSETWEEVKDQLPMIPSNGDPIQLGSPEDVIATIARSVYASTKIEGEEVFAKDVPIAIVGKPDSRQADQDDYDLRVTGVQDAYKAYVWALSQPTPLAGGGMISASFILELHDRMFCRSKPDAAGHFKKSPNEISFGDRVVLRMLPPARVEEFMVHLCGRLNEQFQLADNSGRYSKFLAIGEFLVDFLAIHPFDDGNGRTARLLSTYLLERAGFHFARFYSLDSVILDRHAEYYQVLFDSQRGWYSGSEDLSPWIEFYVACVFAQWLRAYEEILRRKAPSGSA